MSREHSRLYVATVEPYHDNSTLVGVFDTLEDAKASFPLVEWEESDDTWIAELSKNPGLSSTLHWWESRLLGHSFQIVQVDVGSVLVSAANEAKP